MVAVSRYTVGSSLLVLSLLIGCDHNVVEPSSVQFRVAEPPSSAGAVALSEGQIDVTWPDNSSNETGFEVHRSMTGSAGPFTLLAMTSANISSYNDTGLIAATQYCYEVRSFKKTGKQTTYSTFTGAVCATTLPLPAPSAANAVAVSDTRVDVGWQDNSANESGFEVHRSSSGLSGAFALVASTGAGVTSYNDASLAASTQYCYKIRAFQTNGSNTGYSEFSVVACAKTLPPPFPPQAPRLWPPAPDGSTAISVYWDPGNWSSDPAATEGFRLERSLDGGVTWTTAGTDGANDWYNYTHHLVDGGRTPERQVCYRVFAFNRWGESDPSNAGCTAPPVGPTGLTATIVDSQTIEFAWSDNSAVEDGYVVGYFGYGEGGWPAFFEIWNTGPNATSARVTDFDIGLSDWYGVAAVKDGGYSDFADWNVPATDLGAATAGAPRTAVARLRPGRVGKSRLPIQRPRSAVAPRR